MLPKEAIDEFKRIYEREFSETLSDTEAVEEANIFISLYRVLSNESAVKNNIDRNSDEGGL